MKDVTNNELLEELKNRFEEKEKALWDLRQATRKLEEVNLKLRDSEAMKTNFLSNIRNEMINPLSSILGLAKQLQEGSAASPADSGLVAKMICFEAFNLDFQLKNIFMAAEIEAGESVPSIANIDIMPFMQNVVSSFSMLAEEKGQALRFSCSASGEGCEAVFFRTDPEKLFLIVANLLANAVEFSDPGGDILVDVSVNGGTLTVSVRDSGPGIGEEDKGRIFDRFRQLDAGSTKRHRGQGLGLSVVNGLADILKGRIVLESGTGGPSVFLVSLPQLESEEPSEVFSQDGNEFIFGEQEY